MNKNKFIPPKDPILPYLPKAVDINEIRPFILSAVRDLKKNQGIQVDSISLGYFHYKAGSSARIVYRLIHPDGDETIVWGKVLPQTEKIEISSEGKSQYIPSYHMKLYMLPHDENLPGLKNIMNVQWLASHLDLLCPGLNTTENSLKKKNIKLSVISYRPGHRCLIRVEGKIKGAKEKIKFTRYIKVYPDQVDQMYVKTLMDLIEKPQEPFPFFPRLIGVSRENCAVFFESVKGKSLFTSLTPEREKKIARRLSLALREIHTTPVKMSAGSESLRELGNLKDCADSLSRISNELYIPARQLYENLSFDYFFLPLFTASTVHGDFSYEQVLVRKKYIYILDFDRLSIGDSYSDLGNFIANNIDAVLSGKLNKLLAAKFTRLFLREYFFITGEPLNTSKIRWFTAACLLKLAIRPLRRAEMDWQQRAKSVIINGLKVLEGGWDKFFLSEDISLKAALPSKSSIMLQELKKSEPFYVPYKVKSQEDYKLKKAWPTNSGWLFLYERKKAKKSKQFQYIKVSDSENIKRRSFLDERVLTHLPYCLDRENVRKIFNSKAPDFWNLGGDICIEDVRIKSYKPEHRCLIEYKIRKNKTTKECQKLYGKVCRTQKDAEFIFHTSKYFFHILPEIQPEIFSFIPEPMVVREKNAVFFFHISGREFHRLSKEKDSLNALEKIGLGLKAFHESEFQCIKQHLWEDEMKVLERWIKPVERIFPVISRDLNSFFDYLKDKGKTKKTDNLVPVHRDFYDKQILVDGNNITFLDYDNVSLGDPAVDMGNFIAHLYLRAAQMGKDTAYINHFSSIFIEAYSPSSENEFFRRISLYTVTSLLRLACVYLVRPGGSLLFYPLLREINELIPAINGDGILFSYV